MRESIQPGVDVSILKVGKVWRSKLMLRAISRSEALDLLRGAIFDLEAEVEGEAVADQVQRRRGERTDRRGAA